MSIPNDWNVKKQWAPIFKTEPSKEELPHLKGHQMLCPSCKRYVTIFHYSNDSTNYGSIDYAGDIQIDDTDLNRETIKCPLCRRVVFEGQGTLEEYLDEE